MAALDSPVGRGGRIWTTSLYNFVIFKEVGGTQIGLTGDQINLLKGFPPVGIDLPTEIINAALNCIMFLILFLVFLFGWGFADKDSILMITFLTVNFFPLCSLVFPRHHFEDFYISVWQERSPAHFSIAIAL
uniref:Uncharacterized protein n=1 Tax=Sphaerodactylus townsendi TaxID=933632 RepID=A0ACB8EFF4_9SAUR